MRRSSTSRSTRRCSTRLAERAAPAFGAFSGSLQIAEQPPRAAGRTRRDAVVGRRGRRKGHAARRVHAAVVRGERRAARVSLRHHRSSRSAAARVCARLVDCRRRRCGSNDSRRSRRRGSTAYRDWHLRTLPFGRALVRSGDDADAVSRWTPTARRARRRRAGLWSRVFASTDLPDDAARQIAGSTKSRSTPRGSTDTVGSADVRQRGERLDQIAFAQRVVRRARGRSRATCSWRCARCRATGC